MKLFLFSLLLSSSLTHAQNRSEAKAIQIQGPAAAYLYSLGNTLNMTKCYLAIQQSGESIPECELNIMNVFQEEQEFVIDGFAAREMYRLKTNSESVSCFKAVQTDGSSNVECKLKAMIVGRNY